MCYDGQTAQHITVTRVDVVTGWGAELWVRCLAANSSAPPASLVPAAPAGPPRSILLSNPGLGVITVGIGSVGGVRCPGGIATDDRRQRRG